MGTGERRMTSGFRLSPMTPFLHNASKTDIMTPLPVGKKSNESCVPRSFGVMMVNLGFVLLSSKAEETST